MKRKCFCISLVLVMSMNFQSFCIANPKEPKPRVPYRLLQSVEFSSPGSKTMHKAELFGTVNGSPRGKLLKIDGEIMDQNRYVTSQIMLGDVTDDELAEVFFFQYSTGSAGAMGLSVYSLTNTKWRPIFTDPSVTLGESDNNRFNNKYLGNKRIQFYDNRLHLSGVLDMSEFKYSEEQLKKMRFQTDPISEYDVRYENIGCGIETIQWIFAFSHPHAAFSVHSYYRYRFDEHVFSLYERRVQDNGGRILARKVYV